MIVSEFSSVLLNTLLTIISVFLSYLLTIISISISSLIMINFVLYNKARKIKNLLFIYFIIFSISALIYYFLIKNIVSLLLKY